MRDEGRFTDLPKRLRETTEAMARPAASIDLGLWNAHSNAAFDGALKIEALERENERLQEEVAELRRQLGKGCEANNGGDHTVIKQGNYSFCRDCGYSLNRVRYVLAKS